MKGPKHILFYEPRIEGHHLIWLCLICDFLKKQGYQLTIAIDDRNEAAKKRIEGINPAILSDNTIISAYDADGKLKGGNKLSALAECFEESGADEAFCNSLDEFMSNCSRKAALGMMPPKALKGKISGIYFRPRPLDPTQGGLSNFVKRIGFKRLERGGWFKDIFILDEFLVPESQKRKTGGTRYHWLPDPWRGNFDINKEEAQKALGIKGKKKVLLHYGTGSRRKGLKLLANAFKESSKIRANYLLLVAGEIKKEPDVYEELMRLEEEGCAKVLNYYISDIEEKQCFGASDFVMLPYISHYGSSAILSQASAAKRPVIASDYHLVGERVRQHGLGFIFKNESKEGLMGLLEEIPDVPQKVFSAIEKQLEKYANACSYEGFKTALSEAYPGLQ